MQFEAKFVGLSAQDFLAFKLFVNMRGGAFPKWAGEGGGAPSRRFWAGPASRFPNPGGGTAGVVRNSCHRTSFRTLTVALVFISLGARGIGNGAFFIKAAGAHPAPF